METTSQTPQRYSARLRPGHTERGSRSRRGTTVASQCFAPFGFLMLWPHQTRIFFCRTAAPGSHDPVLAKRKKSAPRSAFGVARALRYKFLVLFVRIKRNVPVCLLWNYWLSVPVWDKSIWFSVLWQVEDFSGSPQCLLRPHEERNGWVVAPSFSCSAYTVQI